MILNIMVSLLLLVNIILFILVYRFVRSQTLHIKKEDLDSIQEQVSKTEQEIRSEVRTTQESTGKTLAVNIGELSKTLTNQLETNSSILVKTIGELGEAQGRHLQDVKKSTDELTKSNETSIENVRGIVDKRLQAIQESNEKKLDQMRQTVDEQLQSTLQKRFSESFKIVSERLEAVQNGLVTMQNLAEGVGNLQRVLTNVSSRGAWGEVQLGAILEQVLTPEQYEMNVQPHEGEERVEYAIRLPGMDDDPNKQVWLPIDSKFPIADYERLVDAAEKADKDEEQGAIKALVRTVRAEAKSISEKYISPPDTTDFAIMFLPTEGLYAEVLRQPGEVAELLHKHQIVVAGPTSLAAILISLRVGFRTLAIQKHSSEIRKLLAAVKTEFGAYHNALQLTQRQLRHASNNLEEAGNRSQKVVDKLRDVEDLSLEQAAERLGLQENELGSEV